MSSLTPPCCDVNLTFPVLSLWMRRTSYSLRLFICPKAVNVSLLSPPANLTPSLLLTLSSQIKHSPNFWLQLPVCPAFSSTQRHISWSVVLQTGHSRPAGASPVLSRAEGSFHIRSLLHSHLCISALFATTWWFWLSFSLNECCSLLHTLDTGISLFFIPLPSDNHRELLSWFILPLLKVFPPKTRASYISQSHWNSHCL